MENQTMLDYQRIAGAIRYLETNFDQQPDLQTIAAEVGLSAYHFQRLFSRWAGISPKRFLQFLTLNHAKSLLQAEQTVLDTAYAAGLSGPGRLHDLFVTIEAMSPGEYKNRGSGLAILYGYHLTRFGLALLGVTERGICGLEFVESEQEALLRFQSRWPGATLVENSNVTASFMRRIFSTAQNYGAADPLPIILKGTNFQVQVWQALLQIPAGRLISYGQLAQRINKPHAARAVGGAIKQNPIAYLIPCHRVIRQAGGFGEYRWGGARKKVMIGWEQAQAVNRNSC